MKKIYHLFLINVLFVLISFNSKGQDNIKQSIKSSANLLGFIENKGQIIDQNNNLNPEVKYLLNQPGLNIQLKANSFSYDAFVIDITWKQQSNEEKLVQPRRPSQINYRFHRIDIEFIGANLSPFIKAELPGSDYLNYYTTGTSEQGVTHVKHYGKITYVNLYPGIDLEFLSKPGTSKPVEYNFIVHPGADISLIKWNYNGSDNINLLNGSMKIKTAHGVLSENIPSSFEKETNKIIDIRYKYSGNGVYGFEGKTDIKKTLIIDPLPILNWSTYYGGTVLDETDGVTIDPSGNIVVTGETTSTTNIATTGAYQTTMAGGAIQYLWGGDAYLAKFTSAGVRVWGTYFGGTGEDAGWSLKADKNGDIFVTGDTKSTTGIATTGAFQTTNSTTYHDPFLAKFSTAGTRVWGTYYGGTGNDRATRNGMALDASGNVYITGTNNTANDMWITTVGAYQRTNGSTSAYDEPYVAKWSTTGTLLWGTYYGGPLHDQSYSIALDANNNVYITGAVTSTTLIATTGAHQAALAGGTDAFICKLNSTGSAVLWATYYGGTGTDVGNTIAVDPSGNIIVSGYTTSTGGIASTGAYKTAYMGGAYDGFLLKFSPSGTRIWGTYTGGTIDDIPRTMLVNPSGDIITVMQTSSTSGLSTTDGLQTTYIGGTYDACLQKYTTNGTLKLGTYLGGNLEDVPWHIDMDTKSNFYTVGRTTSTLYISTTGAHQTTFGGGTYDGAITKFQDLVADLSIESLVLNPNPVCTNHNADITVKVKNNGPIAALQMVLALDRVGQNRILSTLLLNNLGVAKDTTITIANLFKSNIPGANVKLIAINASTDLNSLNDTFKLNISILPSPSGSSFIKGLPFNSPLPNTLGTLNNPDIVAEKDTLTYEITTPKGYTNSGYGSTWITNGLTFRTKSGRVLPSSNYKLSAASSVANAKITFLPDISITDSLLTMSISLMDLGYMACDSLLTRNIFIAPRPVTDFSFIQPVCDGDNVIFTNTTTLSSGNFISKWDFGTGNPEDTSNTADVVFKFPTHGTYYVKLTTPSFPYGYTNSKTIAVVVSEIPKIDFKVFNACLGDSVSFVNSTTISKGTIDYKWDLGNGKFSTKVNPKQKYAVEGVYKVTLTATSNKCNSTLTKNAWEFARPVARYSEPSVLCDKTDVSFTNGSTIAIGNMGYRWDFGDGGVSNFANPLHSFTGSGTKIVKMKVISEFGCADSLTKILIFYEAPLADFTTGPTCNLSPVSFTFTGTKPAGAITNFNWTFANEGTSFSENPNKIFSSIGKKLIILSLTSSNGCTDIFSKEINVKLQSKADFNVNDICDGEDVVFINKSTVSAGTLLYNWKFGDGKTSSAQSPRHLYLFGSGTFNVTLVAIVPGGCSDSINKPININANPVSDFTFKTSGRLVYFTPAQSGNTLYHWTFGDGGSSETPTTQYSYLNSLPTVKHIACLTVTNAAGCITKTCKEISITGGIENLNKLKGVKIYPNPNNGNFTLTFEDPKSDIAVSIYNVIGEVIKTVETNSLKSVYAIDLNIANGVYFVKVTNSGLVSTYKITVNK